MWEQHSINQLIIFSGVEKSSIYLKMFNADIKNAMKMRWCKGCCATATFKICEITEMPFEEFEGISGPDLSDTVK